MIPIDTGRTMIGSATYGTSPSGFGIIPALLNPATEMYNPW